MKIYCGNPTSGRVAHICFGENEKYYAKVSRKYPLDDGIKRYIEDHYDHIVTLWNRFVRQKTYRESELFYYSSPILSGLGYPPSYIISLGIIKYIKANRSSIIVLHTQKKELHSFFSKNILYPHFLTWLNSIYIPIKLLFSYIIAYFFLRKKINQRTILVHSYHNDTFFKYVGYLTSQIPDLKKTIEKHKIRLLYDINPSFFSLRNIIKFKKMNCVFAPLYLSPKQFLSLYAQSVSFWIKNYLLFRSFTFSVEGIYYHIFLNLLKRKSISALIYQIPKNSYYIMPWENRGYQLGIEKDLGGKKLIQYSCGLLSKVSTEYVNYRHLRHYRFSLHLAMSKKTRDFLLKVNPNRKIDIVKSPRVFHIKNKSNNKKDILVICPLDYHISNEFIKRTISSGLPHIKMKLHPYLKIRNLKEKFIEHRKLSECLKDYEIAIYEGVTTASVEAYVTGLKVLKYKNNNRLSFDAMDGIEIPSITDFNDLKKISHLESSCVSDDLKNYILGLYEEDLDQFLGELIEKT